MRQKRLWLPIVVVAALAVGLLVGLYAHAANVPVGLAYSGVLKNNGAPETGTHAFIFDLLDGNGTSVCTDARVNVMVTGGRFDFADLFSSSCQLDAALGSKQLLIRITVDGQTLSPAQPLGTVPFAARARVAETVESGAVPSGAVMFFNLSVCPAGWTELTQARGRYLVGLPSGGTLGGTAGTALSNLENRATGAHTHPITSYSSGIDTNQRLIWGTSNNSTGTPLQPTDVLAPTGSVAGTNAPYLQLVACQKT